LKNKKIIYLSIIMVMIFMSFSNVIEANEQVDISEDKKVLTWGEKEVYLTFDDAPGDKVTEEILQILKNYKVKGTFFIVGNRIKGRENILKQIVKEGNSVGLHSYTHKFKKIYSSKKIFMEEMQMTSDEIYDNVGVRTHLLRFPGGSKPFMTKEFLQELHRYQFKVYDWNVPVSDGINAKRSPERFYKEAINSRKFKSPIIILLHCSGENENTVKALPQIIEHYNDLGYNFKTLTMNSPEYYFKVKQ